ncbi:MAG: efflux RND transporter periplasmic adaptor subunit, partial [Methylococcales bacterium]|nr:efflux RND transporter periplasmic adaptor subunit [Methylococcales bacterium]
EPFTASIVQKTVATGKVIPRKEIEIKPRVSGIIRKLFVEPGDQIKKGDLLAQIQIIPNMASLNASENRAKLGVLNVKNAQRDFDRNKQLLADGVIAKTVFQQFEIALENAKLELIAAKENTEIIKKGATSRSGKTSNTNVRATASGMVLDVPVEEGNSVIEANTFNKGTSIAVVANMDDMIFEGKVDESEVGKIKEGMNLLISIGALESESFNAELEHISPKGVEENGSVQFQIRAELKLKEGLKVRANYSANADIVLAERKDVLCINESLLQFEDEEVFVEVETSDQVFEKRKIKTGLSDGIKIELLEGLTKSDKIKNPNKKLE